MRVISTVTGPRAACRYATLHRAARGVTGTAERFGESGAWPHPVARPLRHLDRSRRGPRELYHSINSVCAQKVRIALHERGLEAKEHPMTLAGDQFHPAYMTLNPNAVAPTLMHDGYPVVESSVILYYVDEAFPEPPRGP